MHPDTSRFGQSPPAGRRFLPTRDSVTGPAIAFALFMVVVALTGGSSRPSIIWLVVLRPVTALFIVAMLLTSKLRWQRIAPLPLLLALFGATIALQLVPLPPAFWLGLSGRETYDAVARAIGEADRWRPLALSPDAAWNSLAALLVPLAAMTGFVALPERQRRGLLAPLLGLVGVSMLLGLCQVVDGQSSPLYWYNVSGRGQLIGLFANRNHQGALLGMALPLVRAWMLVPPTSDGRGRRLRTIVGTAVAAVVVLYALVLGSRAGLVLTLAGVVAAILVDPSIGDRRRPTATRWLAASAMLVGVVGLSILALSTDRAVSIDRIVSNDLSTEARLAALPTLMRIVGHVLPLGTGFGSFVPVWMAYEPDALALPSYFNNAHNDLIELAITGGLPALAILGAFLVWWSRAGWRCVVDDNGTAQRALKRASALAILIALLASLTDYPLRTPLMGAIFTILCCWLAEPDRNQSVVG